MEIAEGNDLLYHIRDPKSHAFRRGAAFPGRSTLHFGIIRQVNTMPHVTVDDIRRLVDQLAPPHLAEDWDNVGLLMGDSERPVSRLMTCLTLTPESAAEAIQARADLVVAHHPLPFHALKRITTETTAGRLILQLIEARIAVISPHTCYDSSEQGINQALATALGLGEIQPLLAGDGLNSQEGAGRQGLYASPQPLSDVAARLVQFLDIRHLQRVGQPDRKIRRVAIGCGSAGQFLADAVAVGCDLLITGETNFHTCLEAAARDVCLLLPGHYASERFAVETLAEKLQAQFSQLQIWPSRDERDPIASDTFG